MLPCEFCEILRTPFLQNTFRGLLLDDEDASLSQRFNPHRISTSMLNITRSFDYFRNFPFTKQREKKWKWGIRPAKATSCACYNIYYFYSCSWPFRLTDIFNYRNRSPWQNFGYYLRLQNVNWTFTLNITLLAEKWNKPKILKWYYQPTRFNIIIQTIFSTFYILLNAFLYCREFKLPFHSVHWIIHSHSF